MNISIISNSFVALPAIIQLVKTQQVSSLVVADKNPRYVAQIQEIAEHSHIDCVVVSREDFVPVLQKNYAESGLQLVLVISFPWQLPEVLLDLPAFGFVNTHFGKLPEYRGPDPLFWTLKNGATETAVSFHQMSPAMDEGAILLEQIIPIHNKENYGLLEYRLSMEIYPLTEKLLAELPGSSSPVEQDQSVAKWWPRPTEADLTIDWQQMKSDEILGLIRAANPYHVGARTQIKGMPVNIIEAEYASGQTQSKIPGSIIHVDASHGLFVLCKDMKCIRINALSCDLGVFSTFASPLLGLMAGDVFDPLEQWQPMPEVV